MARFTQASRGRVGRCGQIFKSKSRSYSGLGKGSRGEGSKNFFDPGCRVEVQSLCSLSIKHTIHHI